MATHGIFDTRVEDITERADISKGAFYNYFPSKHDLAAARLQDALAKRRLPRTSEAHARTVVRAHLELFAETPVLALVLHQARAVQYLTTTTAHAGGDDAVSHSPRIAGRLPRPSPEAGHRRPGVRVHSTHQK